MIPGYDAWLTTEPDPGYCRDCAGLIAHPGKTGEYCSNCYDERRAAARGED